MSEIFNLYEYIKENPLLSLVVTIVFTLLIWVYKDSSTNQKHIYESKLTDIEKKLKHLCEIEAIISFYLNTEGIKKNDVAIELYKKLGETNPSFSEDIRKAVIEFYNDSNSQRLVFIKSLIQSKINKLRMEQMELVVDNNSDNVIDYLRNIYRPLKAVGVVVIFLFLVYLFLNLYSMQETMFFKIVFTFLAFSLLFSFTFLVGVIYILVKKPKVLKDYKFILGSTIIFFLPVGPILLNNFIFLIVSFFIQLGIFLYLTNNLKNKKSIALEY